MVPEMDINVGIILDAFSTFKPAPVVGVYNNKSGDVGPGNIAWQGKGEKIFVY